jgi:magnesium-transporting ATPase (P-type)
MVYVNRNRFISIFLTRFYVIAILSVIPYIMGVVHFIQLNNTYILHFTVVPNVCSLWFVIIVFGYYFNICLSFQIFKTIVLLRKERLSIWKVCDRQYPRPLRQLRTMHSSSSITPTCKTQQKIRIFSSFDIGLVPASTTRSFEWLSWNIQSCCLVYKILIYESRK